MEAQNDYVVASSPNIDTNIPSAPSLSDLFMDNVTNIPIEATTTFSQVSAEDDDDDVLNSKDDATKFLPNIRPFSEEQLQSLFSYNLLSDARSYVDQFLIETSASLVEQSELYKLLLDYRCMCTSVFSCREQLDAICEEIQKHHLWELNDQDVVGEAECADGVTVQAHHSFLVAKYNVESFNRVSVLLDGYQDQLLNEFCLLSYKAELQKVKIESFLNPLMLIKENPSLTIFDGLRLAASVLFFFQRRLHVHLTPSFTDSTRTWLDQVCAALLACPDATSTRVDLFLLHHVLRCPSRAGSWAAKYIQPQRPILKLEQGGSQFRFPSFDDPHLNNVLSLLETLLLPIKNRKEFLSQMQDISTSLPCKSLSSSSEFTWAVLDSDGEEDLEPEKSWSFIHESDLIQYLNQIPVKETFSYILGMFFCDNEYVHPFDTSYSEIHPSIIEQNFVRLFAITSYIVNILRNGMTTYCHARFANFTKRLGRLIEHTIQYVSNQWEAFRYSVAPNLMDSCGLGLRIQLEYDNFFFRSVKSIFSSPESWQYLTLIPYGATSTHMLWRIFYMLNFKPDEDHNLSVFDNKINNMSQFYEKLENIPDNIAYYLLAAMANMSLDRNPKTECFFIEYVASVLFHVGFVYKPTSSVHYKNVRDLLSTIVQRYSWVLSTILRLLNINESFELDSEQLHFYLLRGLPFRLWEPSEDDFVILFRWLNKKDLGSAQNQMSRLFFSRIQWGSLMSKNKFDVWFRSRQIVFTILSVYLALPCFSVFRLDPASLIEEGVKQVISTVRQSPEQAFLIWSWETLSRLYLHAFECDSEYLRYCAFHDGDLSYSVPSVTEFFKNISSPTRQCTLSLALKYPLVCYAAVQISSVGHLASEINSNGFTMLKSIVTCGQYHNALECLMNMTPVYFKVGLDENKDFVSIIYTLLRADQTYVKMAKDFISNVSVGHITKEFAIMITKQLSIVSSYRDVSSALDPLDAILFWIRICVVLSNWSKDNNILYVMNQLCRHFFFYSKQQGNQTFGPIFVILAPIFKESLMSKASGGLISWISRSGGSRKHISGGFFSLSDLSSFCLANFPWYSFVAIECLELDEIVANTWSVLVQNLSSNQPGVSLQSAFAAALTKEGKEFMATSTQLDQLLIYKWGQLLCEINKTEDSLVPIIAQKFFSYYLRRCSLTQSDAVGPKFFEGTSNNGGNYHYLERIKTKIELTLKHHKEVENGSEKLVTLLEAFSLWLNDAVVLDSILHLPSLPPQYLPVELNELMMGNATVLWIDFVSSQNYMQDMDCFISSWNRLHFKSTNTLAPQEEAEDEGSTQRIIKRLSSYDQPCGFCRDVKIENYREILPESLMFMSCQSLKEVLTYEFRNIQEAASTHHNNVLKCRRLNLEYLDLVPKLYENAHSSQIVCRVSCSGCIGANKVKLDCTGSAVVVLSFVASRKLSVIGQQIEENRCELSNFQHAILTLPMSITTVGSLAFIDRLITQLLGLYNRFSINEPSIPSLYIQLCSTIFYEMSNLLKQSDAFVLSSAPLRHFIFSRMDTLGQVVIASHPDQVLKLLMEIIDHPTLIEALIPSFTPNVADNEDFLKIYEEIASISDKNINVAFSLLSKVSLDNWLTRCRPSVIHRSKLISQIGRSLRRSGQRPLSDRQLVHCLYRHHFSQMSICDFPEHFGESIGILLVLLQNHSCDPDLWFDLINIIMKRSNFGSKLYSPPGAEEWGTLHKAFEHFALFDNVEIRHEELLVTFGLISNHFNNEIKRSLVERGLSFSLYDCGGESDILEKDSVNLSPLALAAFFSLLGHLLISTAIHEDLGSSTDKLILGLWTPLVDLYAPWICPYMNHPGSGRSNLVNTPGKTFQPWKVSHSGLASVMFGSFVHVIKHLHNSVPASRSILGYVWEFYCNTYAYAAIKDYILEVIHYNLASVLPWSEFTPSLRDLDLMSRIIDNFVPPCHSFLGCTIFVRVDWRGAAGPIEDSPTALLRLLRLVVKLAAEPLVRRAGCLLPVIREFDGLFTWPRVSATNFESLIQWYVMSADCTVVLSHPARHELDAAVFSLLQRSSGHFIDPLLNKSIKVGQKCSGDFEINQTKKRYAFVRAVIRLLISSSGKHKKFLVDHITELGQAVRNILQEIEIINLTMVPSSERLNDCLVLLGEYLTLLGSNQSSPLPHEALNALTTWLDDHTAASPMVIAVLQLASTGVLDDQSHQGKISGASAEAQSQLLEHSIDAFFCQDDDFEFKGRCTWTSLLAITSSFAHLGPSETSGVRRGRNSKDVLEAAVKGGHVLVLYASLIRNVQLCVSIQAEAVLLSSIHVWLTHLCICESNERKLPLLYAEYLSLCHRQKTYGADESSVVKYILDFVSFLSQEVFVPSTTSWKKNILGAIGFAVDYREVSFRGKFLALAIKYFLLQQLSVDNKQFRNPNESTFEEELLDETSPLGKSRVALIDLKNDKTYLGLSQLINWILETATQQNDLQSGRKFVEYIVVDKLYKESSYLRHSDDHN